MPRRPTPYAPSFMSTPACSIETAVGAEEVACCGERAPGGYVRRGVGRPGRDSEAMRHSPECFRDESALPIGTALLCGVGRSLPVLLA